MTKRHIAGIALLLAAFIAALVFIPDRTVFVPSAATLVRPALPNSLELTPEPLAPPVNPLTGLPCASGEPRRPFAVMLAGDTVARPLSGIASADLVMEMPVVTSGINRLLAVFACSEGGEIGSVRSARDDFIPLSAVFDAIFVHWGGSHFALKQLNAHIIDNIDALRNPFGAYFRKRGIRAPHNGFTTPARLKNAAEKLGYRTTLKEDFAGYPRMGNPQRSINNPQSLLVIGYPGAYRVEWRFDAGRGNYLRFRGGKPEVDKNTGAQVTTATVVVIRSVSRQIEGQYNDVRVIGSGAAVVYRYGETVEGRWEKGENPLSAPLRFLDAQGKEIPFAKGSVWIEIVQQDTIVQATSH